MPSALETACKLATVRGHDLEYDPPHSLSSVDRYTCRKCGRAVLGGYSNAYGSATSAEDCTVQPSSPIQKEE